MLLRNGSFKSERSQRRSMKRRLGVIVLIQVTGTALITALALPLLAHSPSPWEIAVYASGAAIQILPLLGILAGGVMCAFEKEKSKRILAAIIFGVATVLGAVNLIALLL